jgi:hypothetical protein
MNSDKTGDAVAEYLYELELRLSGLPVLQRRELLADLEAHITNERAERGGISESELLEILERLGSPEVVAAAAYEEAGLRQPHSLDGQPLAAAGAPSFVGAGAGVGRSLPPIPPPPDSPPAVGPYPPGGPAFAEQPPYAAPPPFTGPPSFPGPSFTGPSFTGPSFTGPSFAGPPYLAGPPAEPAGKTGMRIVVAVGIVAAIFILLACLGASFLTRSSSPQPADSVDRPPPVAPTAVAPLRGN